MRNIIPLSEYGRQQFESIKKAFIDGKYTKKEYNDEIEMLQFERLIKVEVY